MTLNEIAYSILNKIRPQVINSEDIDIRDIIREVHKQRALWIRNEINKNRTVDPSIIQDLGCIDLIYADSAECCDVSTDCTVIRTEIKLPSFIELTQAPLVTRVGPVDKLNMEFSFIPYSRVPYAGNRRFNKNNVYAFLLNNYMYIYSRNAEAIKYLEKINIQGVLENPEDAEEFYDCASEVCYSRDSEYPIKIWMLPYIEAEVIKKFMPIAMAPVDQSNDSRHNIQPTLDRQ